MKNKYNIFYFILLFSFFNLSCEYFVKMNKYEFTSYKDNQSSFLYLNSLTFNDNRSMTISPDGKHLYACDFSNDTITRFNRDPKTGSLFNESVQGTGELIVISGSGKYVYGTVGNNIYVHKRDYISGDLTLIQDYLHGNPTSAIKISENSMHLYTVNNGNLYLVKLDINNGKIISSSLPISAPATSNCLEISPCGKYLYSAGTSIIFKYKRNPITGDLTYESQIDIGGDVRKLTISNDGKFLYADRIDIYKINIDLTSGDFSSYDFFYMGGNWGPLIISKDNNFLYKGDGNTVCFLNRDTITGKLKNSTNYIGSLSNIQGLCISPDDKNIYVGTQTPNNQIAIFQCE